jgi:SHS2 domain-containing protein
MPDHGARTGLAAAAGWTHFPHEADVGLHGYGPTLASAFEQAALALTGAVTDPVNVAAREAVTVHCSAPAADVLLVDWLNALVFEMATGHRLFGRFRVTLTDGDLEATAWGERVDPGRHRPAVEVKGATYTALAVAREDDGLWHARCVIDV